jgi:putative tricarboxylic transport membrane protein
MYGGAISSIMLGIPGASTAAATTFDGRPLALKGEADKALTAAALASFFGGTLSILLFTGFAPVLASIALDFGDPEIFALMLLAFATFVGLSGDDIPKTIFSICIGLVFSAVGLDIMSGEPRLIFFDLIGFMHGVNFLVLAIGIYGIGEMLWTIEITRGESSMSRAVITVERILINLKELLKTWKAAFLGSVLGFFVGILPAAGATPGSPMASLYAANFFAVVINILFIPLFLWMLKMPFTVLRRRSSCSVWSAAMPPPRTCTMSG